MPDHFVRHSPSSGIASTAARVGLFAAVGAVLWTALMFFAAFLALQNDWNGTALTVCAYICCALAAFLCSFLCAKTVQRRKALFGMTSALPILLLILILCIVLYGKTGVGFGIACLLVLCFSALGGFLAVKRKSKKRYKKLGAVR